MRLWNLLTSPPCLIALQQLISIWFLFDFFLAQDSLTADALWRTKNNGFSTDISKLGGKHCSDQILKPPHFDKTIFVIVDALGAEFVPAISKSHDGPDRMAFVEESIRQRKAMGFKAKAATPTVTMPRLKALVSGTIPSFVDIVYNLARDVSKFDEENLLSIAKQQNKSIVFYGDDTWVTLFDRSIFTRSQETFSFFASDYTTIDTNVTDYALPETSLGQQTDWDILILHYLGLDHIGHVFGHNEGQLIDKKLSEMDLVIQNIHRNMAANDFRTLIVVCGDHGMSEAGNHGGGSSLETDTAMIFFPINQDLKQPYLAIEHDTLQVDLAVTLALLTKTPIPKSSKGVAIKGLLDSLWADDRLRLACASLDNLEELVNLMNPADFEASPEHQQLINLTISHNDSVEKFSASSGEYFKIARNIQAKLLKSVAKRGNQNLIVVALILVTFLSLIGLRKACQHLKMTILPRHEKLTCLLVFTLPILMHGSTDFIETERLFWIAFSLGATIIAVFSALISKKSTSGVISSGGLSKHLVDPVKPEYTLLFVTSFALSSIWSNLRSGEEGSMSYIMPALSILLIGNSLRKRSDVKRYKRLGVSVVIVAITLSKLVEESPEFDNANNVYRALAQRSALIVLLIYTAINMASMPMNQKNQNPSWITSKLASSWLCLALLLTRKHNFAYLASNVILESNLNAIGDQIGLSPTMRVLLYLSFAQAAFFNQGHTNSFASIDIKPAFFGQAEFSMTLSIFLVALASFSTQIFWYIRMFQRIHDLRPESGHTTTIAKWAGAFVTIRNFLSLSYYMFVCLVLRNHLFIWSVLSPKLIFHFVTNAVLLVATLLISSVGAKKGDSSSLLDEPGRLFPTKPGLL